MNRALKRTLLIGRVTGYGGRKAQIHVYSATFQAPSLSDLFIASTSFRISTHHLKASERTVDMISVQETHHQRDSLNINNTCYSTILFFLWNAILNSQVMANDLTGHFNLIQLALKQHPFPQCCHMWATPSTPHRENTLKYLKKESTSSWVSTGGLSFDPCHLSGSQARAVLNMTSMTRGDERRQHPPEHPKPWCEIQKQWISLKGSLSCHYCEELSAEC